MRSAVSPPLLGYPRFVVENQARPALGEAAAKHAREAEASGNDARAGEEWRRYRLIRDASRAPDELLADGIALSVLAAALVAPDR